MTAVLWRLTFMCEIRWCLSKQPGTIRVEECLGDECYNTWICGMCAEAIGVCEGDSLPDSVTVKKRINAVTPNVEVTGTAAALSPQGPRGPQG